MILVKGLRRDGGTDKEDTETEGRRNRDKEARGSITEGQRGWRGDRGR
jgi:hypothetical protein